jgi:hypothetical protein
MAGRPVNSSVLVNRCPPLRLEQVDHVEVLALLLEQRADGGQEVRVRVPRPPPAGAHVGDAPDSQRELALAGLDADGLANRLVLVALRDVHDDVAAREPAAAASVDVGVGDAPETDVAPDVDMPRAHVGVDVVVVPVRLVGDAVR